MKKQFYILALLFISRTIFAQLDVSTAKWKSKVIIDGKPDEWSLPLGFYNTETKLFFAVANDSNNLYLCFQSNDEGNQVKINVAGMSVSLSSKGKHRCNATINFPLTDKKSRFAEDDLIAEKKPDMASLKNTFILQNSNMDISGFASQKGVIPINDSSGINAAINWNQNFIMTYELRLPLKELFGKDYKLQDLTKTISIEVEVNAVTEPQTGGVDGSQAAINSTGVGAVGMTQGMPGTGTLRKERKPLFDKNRFKEKFFLCQKPEAKKQF